jgi:hypothetical protein
MGKLRKTELRFAVSRVMLWEENLLFPRRIYANFRLVITLNIS